MSHRVLIPQLAECVKIRLAVARHPHNPIRSAPTKGRPDLDRERAWRRIGRNSGYVAAAGLFVGTVLFLLDATDALGTSPQYHATAAGPLQDEADFYVAYFAHQHHIIWDIIARDSLLPLAFVALIVLSLAVRNLVGYERPEAQLMATFFVIGGVVSALSDLIYLAGTDYWRETGWIAQPASRMVAIGRSSDVVNALTRWPEAAGFVTLAAGLIYLGILCRARDELPSRLALLVNLEALLLVGIAIAGITRMDTPYNILSLLTGALIGPAVGIWLGWHLGHGAPLSRSTVSSP
jgi:hypothetical protein